MVVCLNWPSAPNRIGYRWIVNLSLIPLVQYFTRCWLGFDDALEKDASAAAVLIFQNYTDWLRELETTACISHVVLTFQEAFANDNVLLRTCFHRNDPTVTRWLFLKLVGYVSLHCCYWNRSFFFRLLFIRRKLALCPFILSLSHDTLTKYYLRGRARSFQYAAGLCPVLCPVLFKQIWVKK